MPLVWVSLFFSLGIILAKYFSLRLWVWAAAALLSALPAAMLIARRVGNFPAWRWILPVIFFCGAAWFQFRQPNFDDPFFVGFYNDRAYETLITGTLAEPPDERDSYTNLKINVEAVDSGSGDLPAHGVILARVTENRDFQYGLRVRVRGRLETPPVSEEFSYRDYLAEHGVYALVKNAQVTLLPGNGGNLFWGVVYYLKTRLLESVHRVFPDPEASLLAGILLGVDTGLTPRLQQAFKDTGTAHIIAISGFNIAIIAGIFFNIFRAISGERWGTPLAIAGVFFYALLVGADAAVLRAALMGSLGLFARQLGRRNLGINGLGFATLGMALYNPLILWDVGFQLSALATLGLILYAEPFSNFTAALLSRWTRGDISAFNRLLNDNIVLTFAAQLTTFPIMAYHFQQISLISFIANPFILFAQPAVMILGGLAALAGATLYPLGQLLAWIAQPFAAYSIRVVEFFARVPGGVIPLLGIPFWKIGLFYAALFGITFGWTPLMNWIRAHREALRGAILTASLILLFACSYLLWSGLSSAGDGQLHLTFLEAGSANAALITTPEGRRILINGGEKAAQLSDQLGRRLSFWNRELDWLVIASADEEEIAALPRVVQYYPPQNVLWSGNLQASYSAQQMDKFFAEHAIPVTRAETGQVLQLGADATLKVLSASARGSVLLLTYKNFRAFLPIGVDVDTYAALDNGKSIGKVNVALLADSGYSPTNPPEALQSLNPQLLVLSVSAGDANGLPDPALLEALEGYSLLRTDRNGFIDIITDGETLRVEVARGD